MKESKFNIKDESQDRKYFSIVPNYIINHSTLAERGFYLTLKRIAGEQGSVYYSARELGGLCGIKKSKVYQLINQLLERGWIRKTGSIKAKTKPRTTYGVVDLWQKNINFYENKKNVHSDGKSKIIQKGGQTSSAPTDTKEEPGKEKPRKEINKEKGLIPLKRKYSSIDSLGLAEFEEVAEYYQVSVAFVRSKYDDMVNWHESTGKIRKNWLATLKNFVKSDAIKVRKEGLNANRKRGIDASRV